MICEESEFYDYIPSRAVLRTRPQPWAAAESTTSPHQMNWYGQTPAIMLIKLPAAMLDASRGCGWPISHGFLTD